MKHTIPAPFFFPWILRFQKGQNPRYLNWQDAFWGLCGSGIIANDSVFWLASTIFHSSTVLTTYIWLEYIMTFLGDKIAYSNIYMHFGKFVVGLQACLLIKNI